MNHVRVPERIGKERKREDLEKIIEKERPLNGSGSNSLRGHLKLLSVC